MTSCGCTTVEQHGKRVEIAPGGVEKFEIKVQTSDKRPFHETVIVDMSDPSSKTQKQVIFSIFGSKRDCLTFAPSSINFGTLSPGTQVSNRTVVLRESDTDHFTVSGVETNSLPITYSIEQNSLAHNSLLKVYRLKIQARFPGDYDQLGEAEDLLKIHTNSSFRPELSLPVTYRLAGNVTVAPQKLLLRGNGNKDIRTATARLYFENSSEEVSITPLVVPKGVGVVVEKGVNSAVISITLDMETEPIYFDDEMLLECVGAEWREEVPIQIMTLPASKQDPLAN